jgi:hypothetical protein
MFEGKPRPTRLHAAIKNLLQFRQDEIEIDPGTKAGLYGRRKPGHQHPCAVHGNHEEAFAGAGVVVMPAGGLRRAGTEHHHLSWKNRKYPIATRIAWNRISQGMIPQLNLGWPSSILRCTALLKRM